MGEYRASRDNADRFVRLAQNGLDRFIGDRMLSMTLFCMGDFRGARRHADLMLAHDVFTDIPPRWFGTVQVRSIRFRANTACSALVDAGLSGSSRASRRNRRRGGANLRSRDLLCESLARWACPVLVHVGDLAAADSAITELLDLAKLNGLGPWEVFGRCWKAALLIQRGLPGKRRSALRSGLAELRQVKLFNLYNVRFVCALAEGLASLGSTPKRARSWRRRLLQAKRRTNSGTSLSSIVRRAISFFSAETATSPSDAISSPRARATAGRAFPGAQRSHKSGSFVQRARRQD